MKTTSLKKAADPFVRWFWKTQIGILRACPPLCGVVFKLSLSAASSTKVWIKTLFQLAVQTPQALFFHCRDKWNHRVVLSRVSYGITTRCTLNCDKCAGHIPDLKKHRDVPLDDWVHDIRPLLSCVDYIYTIFLSGGEPFLHPDLHEMIRVCADSGKIGNISVQTNGTVLPDAKTLAALRETKSTVRISGYSETLQPDIEKLKHLLKENGIGYTHTSAGFWYEMGSFGQLQTGSEKRRFSICIQQLCLTYFNKKLHVCGESCALIEEGLIPDSKEDYVDLRTTSPAAFRGQYEKLLKRQVASACSYCLGYTYKTPRVPVAVQREF